jgi:hypothetical protein
VWGFGLALATATARLRTRAEKHFYSDVIVAAIVGAGVGYLVPRQHRGPAYSPSGTEWVVIGAAPIAGLALAQLVPAKPTITRALTPVALPFITPNGGGMMLAQLSSLAVCLQSCVRYESSRGRSSHGNPQERDRDRLGIAGNRVGDARV